MLVIQAYRFALDPTPRQQGALASHCGAARHVYNWGLDLVRQRLAQRAAGLDVEVPWTLPALRREWNHAKHQTAPWWRENSKEAYSSGLDALARALKNWSDSNLGRRMGLRVGFPKFKSKRRARKGCRFTTGPIRVDPDRHHVVLPRIGRNRTHESTRKLARRLEGGTARILAATITCTADRCYVSFTCEVQRRILPRAPTDKVIGVDVGIGTWLCCLPGRQSPTPYRSLRYNSDYSGSTGSSPAATAPAAPTAREGFHQLVGSRPVDASPERMPAQPTCAATP
jgi:putative transposase